MQQLIELLRVDAQNGLALVDQSFIDHLDRDPDGCRCGALAGACLQQIEGPAFHRELEVLHLAVVLLESLLHLEKLSVRLGQAMLHLLDRQRCPDACDDVLTLRVDQKLAEELPLTRRRIAGERDAGTRVVTEVAVHHCLHVDGRTQVVRDAVHATVCDGALDVP